MCVSNKVNIQEDAFYSAKVSSLGATASRSEVLVPKEWLCWLKGIKLWAIESSSPVEYYRQSLDFKFKKKAS